MKGNILFDEETGSVHIEGYYTNDVWFQKYGSVQQKILCAQNTILNIDMRKCTFISPTPFLSLLLSLTQAQKENNCDISIELPNDDNIIKQKFLNYCSREGFIDIINSISLKKYDSSKINSYNVVGNRNYENVYKAQIFQLNKNENNIKEIVEKIISEINESNLNIPRSQKLYIIISIRNILQELIDNVDKHAYLNEEKLFSLYIRIRYSNEKTMRIGKENNIYGSLNTTTKPDEIYTHKAIEIYFQDIGKGIIKSYEEKGIFYPNRPLREIIRDTFFREKFENRDNNTPINGLAFLRKIIEEKNNFFCVFNDEEGAGNFGVNDKRTNVNNIHMGDLKQDEKAIGIKGQIYNFTLFNRDDLDFIVKTQEPLEHLLETYSRPFSMEKMKKLNVVDLRIEDEKIQLKGLKSEVILFVPKYLTKNLIIDTLRRVFDSSDGIRRLIIADIEDEELMLFDHTFKNLFAKNIDEKNYLQELYIVTKSLKVIQFKTIDVGSRLIKQEMTFTEFNEKNEYLYKIKIYESQYFAQILEKNLIGEYILTKGDIEWTDNQHLDGYINFDMMSSNDICFDLLVRNLKRIISIVGNKRFYAIDSAVERIVETVNMFVNGDADEQFGVGSVIVSGLTVQSSNYRGNIIHFFSRDLNKRRPALFFEPIYLYKKENNKIVDIYVRVGKSSRIKKKNYKELKRNTNSFLKEKQIYKLLHQYAYSAVLCGHLNFEKRHDLVSINLEAIMYDKNTGLQDYVTAIIQYGLGHYDKKTLSKNDLFDMLRNSCLIIYPYNYFTSSILKMCKEYSKYRKYIIGLSPSNIIYQGENLEYSDCFTEYISEIIREFREEKKNSQLKVIIFDTLSYSGITKREIYEYINSIENVIPYFASIIDARVDHYEKQINCINYMNINIPLIGKGETCKICLALNKLFGFKDYVIDASILSSIENIEKVWKVHDVRNYKEIIKLPNFDRIYANNIVTCTVNTDNDQDALYFVNALPLYIFLTNRIKMVNDYSSMEFLLDSLGEIVGSDSVAYISALFLLEYGEVVYFSLLAKTIKILLAYLKDSKELYVSQFVVLALLSISDGRLIKPVSEYISEDETCFQSGEEGQIVLMYCLKRGITKSNNIKTSFLYNKMKSGNNRLDLYKQFHCQIKNTNGNVHNSPLQSIIRGQANIENTRLTLASLSLFEESINCAELAFDILYEEGRDADKNEKDISLIREKCLRDIKCIKTEIYKTNNYEFISTKLNEVFYAGQEMHKRLFAPYIIKSNSENRNEKTIISLLADRIDIYNNRIREENKNFPISFDESYEGLTNTFSDISAIYYIWNNMLIREIDYILDNVGKFVDQSQTVIVDNIQISGQVRIKISLSEFKISIFNNTKERIEDIRKRAKQRYQKEVLKILGVKFEYFCNEKENLAFLSDAVVTQITIPNIQNVKEN